MSSVDRLRRAALALVGFTLPFEYTTLIPLVINLTPNKLATLVLLAVVMLQFAAQRPNLPPDPKRLWVAFFGVAVTVSALQSILTGVEVDPVRRVLTTVYLLILFYFMMSIALRQRSDVDLLLGWFAVGGVVTILTGWLGFGQQIEGVRASRLAGEGSSPNLLAFNLLVAITGAASLYFTARSRAWRFTWIGLIVVMTAGVIGTLSRSAYVALPLMGLLWAVRFRRVGFLKYAAPGLLLVAGAALLAPEEAVERIGTLTPAGIREDESAMGRLQMIPDSFRAFVSNPLTGTGLQGYIDWALRNGMKPHGIHNAFLQVLAENGLLGFVPFVAITILAWRDFTRAWRLARRAGSRRDAELRMLEIRALLLQIGFAGILVMSLAQPSMHHKSLWLLFVLPPTLLALVRERAREVAPEAEPAAHGWDPAFAAKPHAPLEPGTR